MQLLHNWILLKWIIYITTTNYITSRLTSTITHQRKEEEEERREEKRVRRCENVGRRIRWSREEIDRGYICLALLC